MGESGKTGMRDRKKTRKKRIGTLLLAMCLLFGTCLGNVQMAGAASLQNAWDGTARSIPETDEEGVFLITTGAELAWFADYVNAGHANVNARLQNTIYLNTSSSSYRWVIIGDSEENPYSGHFDGNGKQIVNMLVRLSSANSDQHYGGLFGVVDGGFVENVRVSGYVRSQFADSNSLVEHELYAGTGGIAGYLKSGSIVNCINYTKTIAENYSFYRNAGGVVGISEGLIIRCTNNGNLTSNGLGGQYRMGGIVGSLYGPDAKVLYCENYGAIQGYFQVGGIAGAMQYGSEIKYSCNYGDTGGRWYIGGIVGRMAKAGTSSDGSTKENIVKNACSLGDITDGDRYAGGIVGEAGYQEGDEEDNPSMPVVENVYTTAQIPDTTIEFRAAIISHFKSGKIGNAYGMSGSELNPVGQTRTGAVKMFGPVEILTEEELKESYMITRLGSAFAACSKYFAYQNDGFPMLQWQVLASSLAVQVDNAVLELTGWLTEANKVRYGENYTLIEDIVGEYVEILGDVTTSAQLTGWMEEARAKLAEVVAGVDVDNALVEAIDNAIIRLEEYLDSKIAENDFLSESQISELEGLVHTYEIKLNEVQYMEEINGVVTEGKEAINDLLDDFIALARLEIARENAILVLTEYRAATEYEEPWNTEITIERNRGLRLIKEAETVSAIATELNKAKAAIDALIDQIPAEGAWDGETNIEPAQDENGIYQITSGAELAWFATEVNKGNTAICAELCNDISLGNHNWTPIGYDYAFQGSFNGNNHKVQGLSITKANTAAGLFGAVAGSSEHVIENLTVSGVIDCGKTVGYAGGIAAYVSGDAATYIVNCHSQVNITIEQMASLNGAVGGITGFAQNAVIQNCSNSGSVVIASQSVGGIAFYSGGITGAAGENYILKTSYNSGYVEGEYSSGGLLGTITGTGEGCLIRANYNTGEIQGGIYAGGLIGHLAANIEMDCCYSTGPVNLSHNGKYLGALFGGAASGTISNLYVLKLDDQPDRMLVGYSAGFYANGSFVSSQELQSDDMLNRLNATGANFIKDYLNYHNGYPLLAWQMTLEELRLGATSELQTFVSAEDYTEENWVLVQEQMNSGIAAVQAAGTMEEVNAALVAAKSAIWEIETKAEAAAKLLQEAKDAAVDFLNHYVDPTLYREEEQFEINLYISDGIKWIQGAETEDEVAKYLNQAKENIDALPTELQYQYEIDSAAAAQADAYILNIGEVVFTPYVKVSIRTARTAYDSLTEDQKLFVQNYQILLDAEEAYRLLEEQYEITPEDEEVVAVVNELIAAIGEVTKESGDAIKTARNAYDGLTEKQKAMVVNGDVLVLAEQTYDEICARDVSAAIAAIGEVTVEKLSQIQEAQKLYDALTDAQKALVTDYNLLVEARFHYENLVAAAVVIELIDKIGTVTLDSGNAITAAVNAYNNLTGNQQELVTNYDAMEQAVAAFDNMVAIHQVEEKINLIGAVNSASGPFIRAARAAYDALTEDQKAQVFNLHVLMNAEAAYQALNNRTESANQTTMSDLYQNASGGTASNGTASDGTTSGTEHPNGIPEAEEEEVIPEDGRLTLDDLVFDDNIAAEDESSDGEILLQEEAVQEKETEKKTENLLILVIIASAIAAVDVMIAVSLKKAAKKRKDRLLHY